MRINVLSPGFTSSNGTAFLFPLVVHRDVLAKHGMDVRIVSRSNSNLLECDVLAVDSKEFRNEWSTDSIRVTDLLKSYKSQVEKLIWFDTTDSSGTLQSGVLPIVDKYLKAQLLVDRQLYTREIYGGRLHSEFYHERAGIADEQPDSINSPIEPEHMTKLGPSWNSGLADYSLFGPWKATLYRKTGWRRFLNFPYPTRSSGSGRSHDVSARFGISYNRKTVRYQREQMTSLLGDKVPTKKLGRRRYMKELQDSRIVVSPFGWGEITLKDFEVFLTGGLLLKPNMGHMETWPNFYEDERTYASHAWDLSDLVQRIDDLLSDHILRSDIAAEGQVRYAKYTSGPDAGALFAKHFKNVIE